MRDVLQKFLTESQGFSCEYSAQLSNHLPMALIALYKIGEDEFDLSSFYKSYAKRLKPQLADTVTINEKNWQSFLGQHRFNQPYREFFLSQLASRGFRSTFEYYLPILLPGVSGGAFHPLIRLAYAIEVQSEWETAEALASWCMAYLELGSIGSTSSATQAPAMKFLEVLSKEFHDSPFDVTGDNIFTQMAKVTSAEFFKRCFNRFDWSSIRLDDIAETAIQYYSSSKDSFVGLHCVTATHAMRVLLTQTEAEDFLQYLWQGVCAAYLTDRCPKTQTSFSDIVKIPGWEEIFKATHSQKDDHVIKFVYTAHEEWLCYNKSIYQIAAAKKSGLVSW